VHVDSWVRLGRDYLEMLIVATVDAADVAEALDLAWRAFRKAAGDDAAGWDMARHAAFPELARFPVVIRAARESALAVREGGDGYGIANCSVRWARVVVRQLSGAVADIRGRRVEDDEGAAPEAPGNDPHARGCRPEVPAGRRSRSSGSVPESGRSGWSAATRPGPRRGDGASGPAGAREAQVRLTAVRILDLLILSVTAAARPADA
jgi:hypothetical protein